jgi:DNA polymerase-3 subunit delta
VSIKPGRKSGAATFEDLQQEIKAGRVATLYLFVGEERYLHERALQLLYQTVDEALLAFNISLFSIGSDNGFGSKTTAAMAIDAANQLPMMSSRRVVVIRDFDKIKEDEQEIVLRYLKEPSPTTTVVFQAVSPDKRRKLTGALVKSCEVISFDLLDDGRAGRWAEQYLKQRGCRIAPDAIRVLIELVGTPLTRLSNELDKLAAYADGRVIDSAAVNELVGRVREHNGWELWDAITAPDRKHALKLMQRLLDDGDALPVLGSLAGLYRRLLIGKDMLEQGASDKDVMNETRQFKRAFVTYLRRTPRARLATGLRRIAEVDNAIKNSEATPRLLMENLLVELTLPSSTR